MTKKQVKVFDRDQVIEVDVEEGDCEFCEAGRHANSPGVVFFERTDGMVQRTDVVNVRGIQTMVCETVTVDHAKAELAQYARLFPEK